MVMREDDIRRSLDLIEEFLERFERLDYPLLKNTYDALDVCLEKITKHLEIELYSTDEEIHRLNQFKG